MSKIVYVRTRPKSINIQQEWDDSHSGPEWPEETALRVHRLLIETLGVADTAENLDRVAYRVLDVLALYDSSPSVGRGSELVRVWHCKLNDTFYNPRTHSGQVGAAICFAGKTIIDDHSSCGWMQLVPINPYTHQDGGHSDPTTKEEQWKSSQPKPASPPTK